VTADRQSLRCALISLALLVSAPAPAQDLSPVGRWRTIDDRTNVEKSIVRITEVNGEIQGIVEVVFSPPAPNPTPICQKCPGVFKDKPVVGMRVLWGLKKDGDEYTGGHVFDPDNQKTYKCKLKVVDGGKKLELRGYIGFSMLGRTQTWVRDP
jgi:uncharacterized protein (DUF2147 family)